MGIPQRYKDIIEYFDGASVMAELTDGNKIETNKFKAANCLYLNFHTILGPKKHKWQSNNVLFKTRGENEDNFESYFPFTITLDREKDEVNFSTILPSAIIDTSAMMAMFVSQFQVEKMYRNGFIFELKKSGMTNVELTHNGSQMFQIKGTLHKKHDHNTISYIYNKINEINTTVYKSQNL